jgi:hypothetical protein
MSAASNYLEAALLEHFRGTQLPLPSGLYLALHTNADDGTDSTTNEVTVGAWPAYTRMTVGSPLSSAWTASADEATGGGKLITNANTINFPANNGASSVIVRRFSIWDSASGGNMWASAALTADKTIDPTDIFSAVPGALRLIAR